MSVLNMKKTCSYTKFAKAKIIIIIVCVCVCVYSTLYIFCSFALLLIALHILYIYINFHFNFSSIAPIQQGINKFEANGHVDRSAMLELTSTKFSRLVLQAYALANFCSCSELWFVNDAWVQPNDEDARTIHQRKKGEKWEKKCIYISEWYIVHLKKGVSISIETLLLIFTFISHVCLVFGNISFIFGSISKEDIHIHIASYDTRAWMD